MEPRVKIFLLCALAFQSVLSLPYDGKDSSFNDAIANHPMIKQLISRVEFLEEKDKINTEIISELKIRLERCDEGQNEHQQLVTDESIDEKANKSADSGNEKYGIQWRPVKPNTDGRIQQKKNSFIKSRVVNNHIRQVSPGDTVAFFAKSTTNDLHIGPNQNIIFENVTTNIGNGFNSHHGIFVAPISGTYVFSTTILAYNNAEVWVHFAVNGANVANTYARGTDGRHDSGSQTVIVTLTQGDDVTVQSNGQDENIYGESYTTFSGFLLSSKFVEPIG